jgi:Cu2+-exporting ATPase
VTTRCRHCHAAVPVDGDEFCCHGCRTAHAFITEAGFERYQTLADGPLPPGGAPQERPWLPGLIESSPKRIEVDVQGLTCGACVWVLQKAAERRGLGCLVNPGLGRLEVDSTDRARLDGFLDDVETLGYRTGPPLKKADASVDDLVLRAGISGALAMAAMSFAFARYFGLNEGALSTVFFAGEALTATGAMIAGGTPFISSAWRAAKMRIVSFDVPIAMGLLLAWFGSVASVLVESHEGIFFDSVAMFATLMVFGRLAQRSVLARSRAQLLNDSGLEGLAVMVLVDGVPTLSTAAEVRSGDRILVRPGDAVVVASRIEQGEAPFSLAWITGESDAQLFGADLGSNPAVPAGACHIGDRAVTMVAAESGADSRLAALLTRRDDDEPAVIEGWERFARASVFGVLAVAIAGAVGWTIAVDLERGLTIATAVLVVTCPCALGLALPLADELGLSALRRYGVFVRRGGFFDRLRKVKDVVFDKTGTLTAGELVLERDSVAFLDTLADADRDAVFQMAARSSHPKSRALVQALGARTLNAADVVEVPGVGMTAVIDNQRFSLRADGDSLAVTRDGATIALLNFSECLQQDAVVEVKRLQQRGLTVHLASGDALSRAERVAAALGITEVHAGMHPEEKAALVSALGAERVCFVGDGINDAAAFSVAGVAGTPALDRPQLPARADFYTISSGLGPLGAIFAVGDRHHSASQTALGFAVVYNTLVISAALAGVLTPLWCALLMPASSVLVVLMVRFSFTSNADRQDVSESGNWYPQNLKPAQDYT